MGGGRRKRSSVRNSGLCRAGCANETASGPRSLVWPNREAGFRSLRVVTPPLRPGLIKGGSWSCPPCFSPVCLALSFASLLCPLLHCSSLSAHLWIYTRGWCATDVLLGLVQSTRFHEPGKVTKQEKMHRLEVGTLKWSVPQRYTLHSDLLVCTTRLGISCLAHLLSSLFPPLYLVPCGCTKAHPTDSHSVSFGTF